MLYSGGVWAVTCTHPLAGTTYAIPLGDRSRAWDLIKVVIPRQWGGNVCQVDDPQYYMDRGFPGYPSGGSPIQKDAVCAAWAQLL